MLVCDSLLTFAINGCAGDSGLRHHMGLKEFGLVLIENKHDFRSVAFYKALVAEFLATLLFLFFTLGNVYAPRAGPCKALAPLLFLKSPCKKRLNQRCSAF